MSQQTTFAPSRPKSRAVARPIPLLAPVIIATFPLRRPSPCRNIGCSSIIDSAIFWSSSLDRQSSILDPLPLPAIELLNKAGLVQFSYQTHVDKCFGVRRRGFRVFGRKIVEHRFHAVRRRIGNFRKCVCIILVCSFQPLGIGNTQILFEERFSVFLFRSEERRV